MNDKRLRRAIEQLLEGQSDNQRLRDNLEGLSRHPLLPALTWYWGPKLYARSSAVFRPFILNHFSEWTTANNRWDRVHWADHTADLEAWLQAARTIALDEFDDWFQLDEATAISLPKSEHAHGFVRARSIAGAACRQGGGAALRHQELPTIVMLALSLAAHDPSET